MKKMYLLLLFMSVVGTYEMYAQGASKANTEEVSIPCLQDAFDTDDAVAAWGVGKSSDRKEAISLAMQDATESLARRFNIDVKDVAKYVETRCRHYTRTDNNGTIVYTSIGLTKSVLFRLINEEHK